MDEMWIELLGWLSTLLVLIGFWCNSTKKYQIAMTTWILGDIGWITYDIFIMNWSHMVLSLVIIGLNIFGIYKLIKKEDN